MTELANWIVKYWQGVTVSMVLAGITVAFYYGKLWSNTAVMLMRADFEVRDAEKTKLCEYERAARERLLIELERAISANKILASKAS